VLEATSSCALEMLYSIRINNFGCKIKMYHHKKLNIFIPFSENLQAVVTFELCKPNLAEAATKY
jgi:hypothetical protein